MGFYRQLPIPGPVYSPTNQNLNLVGVSGIYSGLLPALLLALLAIGSGVIVSQLGKARMKEDEAS